MRRDRTERRFLSRPAWRDWVGSYVLIGVGFIVSSPGWPLHNRVGYAIVGAGLAVFVAALVHAFRNAGR